MPGAGSSLTCLPSCCHLKLNKHRGYLLCMHVCTNTHSYRLSLSLTHTHKHTRTHIPTVILVFVHISFSPSLSPEHMSCSCTSPEALCSEGTDHISLSDHTHTHTHTHTWTLSFYLPCGEDVTVRMGYNMSLRNPASLTVENKLPGLSGL